MSTSSSTRPSRPRSATTTPRLELAELNRELDSLEADQSRQGDVARRRPRRRARLDHPALPERRPRCRPASCSPPDSEGFLDELATLSTDRRHPGLAPVGLRQRARGLRRSAGSQTERASRRRQGPEDGPGATRRRAPTTSSPRPKSLLVELEEEERAEILSRGGYRPRPDASSIPASGRAKVGHRLRARPGRRRLRLRRCRPERLGLLGPDDGGLGARPASACRTPRGRRSGSGAPVSRSDLQPGDLVFYYSPVSHVGDLPRQRHDRARGQPGRGREGVERRRDAVRRSGPAWVTRPGTGSTVRRAPGGALLAVGPARRPAARLTSTSPRRPRSGSEVADPATAAATVAALQDDLDDPRRCVAADLADRCRRGR